MSGWFEKFGTASFVLNLLALSVVSQARAQDSRASAGAAPEQASATSESSTTSDAGSADAASTSSVNPAMPFDDRNYRFGRQAVSNFFQDQRTIWTSPARLRFDDLNWLVPVSGFAAGLFVTDRDVSTHLSNDPKTISHYKNLSNAGVAALVGGAGALWLLGHPTHNDHWRETGFLAGEAAVDSLVVTETLKYSLGRQRPFQGDGGGAFFQGGTSFPSEHAAAAWSVAGVIAHEYPGPLPKIVAYGLASLVSYSRIRGRQHFPSDVFVGSLMGEMVGQNVFSTRHDPELGGDAWQPLRQVARGDGSPANTGSPYVPLDSWIYPAMERLAGMGLFNDEFMGMRPWTRSTCAHLVGDAAEELSSRDDQNSEASTLIEELQREFQPETEVANTNNGNDAVFRLESAYSRTEYISGAPLTDGYTFAQTQINDFGRPYGEGWSTANGFSAYSTWGRWVTYVRGEEQSAPSIPALPLPARQFSAAALGVQTLPPASAAPAIQQFQLLDAYVGINISNWQVSFGRQSFLWGPGDGGALMLSNDATPFNALRINRVSPLLLPSFLRFLGPVRMEFFVGQLEGQRFVLTASGVVGSWTQSFSPQPFTQGEKISLKPSRDLEIGFSYTTMFAGLGVPATVGSLVNSIFDTGADLLPTVSTSSRETGLDFTYRIPKLRRWLTLYGDGFAHDQIIYLPFGYPERAVWRAGIYIPMFPKLRKLDLRAEGGYTNSPLGGMYSRGFYNTAARLLNGATNNGNLLGSWLGRASQGEQAWTNYWLTSRSRIQINLRHQTVSAQFVPGGGSLTDIGARADYWIRPNLSVSTAVQHERWLFPVIQPKPEKNVSASVQILFQPQKLFGRSSTDSTEDSSEHGGQP